MRKAAVMDQKLQNIEYQHEYTLIRKSAIRYIIPATLTLACGQIAPIIDSICISGGLGDLQLSATSVAMPILYIFNIIGALGGVGCAITVSKCSGSGEKEKAGRAFTMTFFMMVLATIICDLLLFIFIDKLLIFCGATDDNINFAKEYLYVILAGSVFITLMFAGDYILTGDNSPKLALAGNIVAVVVNALIDVIGIFVLHLGIWVTAFGTVFSMFCCCVVYATHLRKPGSLCRFVFTKVKGDKGNLLEFIKPGIPLAVMYALYVTETIVQNNILRFANGSSGLGDAAVIENLQLVITLFLSGASETVMPLSSSFFGEKNRSCMLMSKRVIYRIGMLILFPILAILIIFPQLFIMIYNIKDPVMLETLPAAIRIISLSSVFIFLGDVAVNYLSAIEEERNATISYFIQFGVHLTLIWLISKVDAENAPWYANLFSNIAATAFLLFLCKQYKGIIGFCRENALLMTGGKAASDVIAGWKKAASEILTGEQMVKVSEKLLDPFENAIPQGEAPLSAFTILDREDGGISVILRYNSKKDYLGDGGEEDEDEILEKADSLYDECIRSEFNSMRRMMLNLKRSDSK